MTRNPRRSGLWWTAALGLVLLVPFPAAGFTLYTTLDFSGDLSGYSITIKDPFAVGDMLCEYLDEFGEPTAGPSQFYSCEGWDYGDVIVSTTVIAPNSSVWHFGAAFGSFEAWESYYISQPEILGNWMAVSNHHVDIDGIFEWCLPVPPQMQCGFMQLPLWTNPLGQTADYALAHWGLPCNPSGIETAVITVMSTWAPLAWERGGTIRCFSGFAIPTDLRDSFNDHFPGNYNKTNDPCTLNMTKSYAAAGFHSHPRFDGHQQYTFGNGCFGDKTQVSGSVLNALNNRNRNFSEPDVNYPNMVSDLTWGNDTGTPLYLLVPDADLMKRLDPDESVSTVWP